MSNTEPSAEADPAGPAPELASPERILERRRAARGRERLAGAMIVLALLLAAGLAGRRVWRVASGDPPPAAGTEAPGFSAPRLDGGRLALSDLRGDVVVLDFWATWCPPCVASLPGLDRLHARFREQGLTVVGINQEPEDLPRVRAFVAKHGLGIPVVVDPGDISLRYGVHSLPTTFVLDGEGVIRATFRGAVSEKRLEQTVEAIFAATHAAL